MSIVSKLLRNTTRAVGHAADRGASKLGVNKLDFLNFMLPGSGYVASGVDAKRHGKSFGSGLLSSAGNTAKLGAMAYGAHALAGAAGGAGGAGGGGGVAGGAAAPTLDELAGGVIPNVGTIADPGREIVSAGTARFASSPSRFRSILGALSKHKNDILDYGSAAEMLAQQHRRNKMQDELLARARADDPRRQQLRTAGTNLLMDDSAPDLSGVFSDPNDPARGRYRRVQVGSSY